MAMLLALATLPTGAQAQPMGTLVKMNYAGFGDIYLDLFDGLTPITTSNFKQYINTDRYDGTIIHRVNVGPPPAVNVIQGGGFNTDWQGIQTFGLIPLEYNRANTRGTISMARYFDQQNPPNTTTATSQFFINLVDNTDVLGQNNSGGYAVFGWVVGPGMQVADAIADVDVFAFNQTFSEVPLTNYTQEDRNNGVDPRPHAVVLTSVEIVREHDAYQNPFLKGDVNNNGSLTTRDLLDIVDELNANGTYTFTSPFAGGKYFDVSGDGRFSTRDLADVVTELVLQSQAQSQAVPLQLSGADLTLAMPMAEGFSLVPEPATWALGATALLAFGGLAARRRQRSLRGRR